MPIRNYYDILGVELSATQDEIRKSYLMRCRVLHPDRFDPGKQFSEWKQANEMLATLNEAYSILRDVRKRSDYDLSMGFRVSASQSAQTPNTSSSPREETKSPAENENSPGAFSNRSSKTNTAPPHTLHRPSGVTRVHFRDLPSSSQHRLLSRQRGKFTEQFRLQTGSVLPVFIFPLVAIGWILSIVWFANGFKWPLIEFICLCVGTLISMLVLWWAISTMYLWRTAQLKPCIYITPLYYIKTYFDEIWFWWLWDLEYHEVVHNQRNGNYTNTSMIFGFSDADEKFNLNSHHVIKQLFENLEEWEKRYERAIMERDMHYFQLRDDFLEFREDQARKSSNTYQSYLHASKYKRFAGYALAALLAVGWMAYAYNLNRYFDDKKSWELAVVLDKATGYRNYISSHHNGKWARDAESRISGLYDMSAKRYVDARSRGFDTDASNAVLQLLNYAKESRDYHVSVAFIRKNEIPTNVEDQLKLRLRVRNIESVGTSFSDSNMQLRERYILDAIKTAFATVIPDDILEFSGDSDVGRSKPVFLVTYTVASGDSLYYRDKEEVLPLMFRRYYPGIFINWNFEIRLPVKEESYEFALESKPAQQFSDSSSSVYDAMAQSAFDDFRGELIQRLGLSRFKKNR